MALRLSIKGASTKGCICTNVPAQIFLYLFQKHQVKSIRINNSKQQHVANCACLLTYGQYIIRNYNVIFTARRVSHQRKKNSQNLHEGFVCACLLDTVCKNV